MPEKSSINKRKSSAASEPQAHKCTESAPQPTIDEVLHQLEDVVEALEAGDLPLEAALARFEEGVRLVRQGGELLDRIEQRVEVLLAERESTIPFTGKVESNELEEDDGR